jgi:predicted metal-binding protein
VIDPDIKQLNDILFGHGFTDFKLMDTKDTIVSQWVRLKCMFGCSHYGKNGCCPPYVPSVTECREFFSEYKTAVLVRLEKAMNKPEERFAWSREMNMQLLKVERDVFLAGWHKSFLLFMDECRLCSKCAESKLDCKNPRDARPSIESFAVDVFATVRKQGFPIKVLKDYDENMNRYAILMLE